MKTIIGLILMILPTLILTLSFYDKLNYAIFVIGFVVYVIGIILILSGRQVNNNN